MAERALRLFALKNRRTRQLVKAAGIPEYFASKRQAKFIRDQHEDETGEEFVVTFGPDHKKYKGAKP